MVIRKKSDRTIIISIFRYTRNDEIFWYKTNESINSTTWKSTKKITNSKYLSFVIDHRIDKPEKTKLIIYLEKREYKDGKVGSINTIKVKEINERSVMVLLKIILKKENINVIDSAVGIIRNNEDPNNILLVKRYPYDRTLPNYWVLPGGKKEQKEKIEDSLIREIKEETGLNVIEQHRMNYKSLFNIGNKTYMLDVYIIDKYDGDINIPNEEIEDYKWVNITEVITNKRVGDGKIGKQILNVLDFYFNDELPF